MSYVVCLKPFQIAVSEDAAQARVATRCVVKSVELIDTSERYEKVCSRYVSFIRQSVKLTLLFRYS